MEVSTDVEELVTEKTFTKIEYNGHEDIFVELAPLDIIYSGIVVTVALYFETDIEGESPPTPQTKYYVLPLRKRYKASFAKSFRKAL